MSFFICSVNQFGLCVQIDHPRPNPITLADIISVILLLLSGGFVKIILDIKTVQLKKTHFLLLLQLFEFYRMVP